MLSSSTSLREGTVLADKYRVERVLGAGGMGMVVAAYHLQLDERVAIKMLLPETLLNPEAVARFAREARAAVKIKSEHVARVTDVGVFPDGGPYLVMEYLEGEDLSQMISKRGAVGIEQAVEFVLQACEALAEAHSLGIIHRDLKPANLFVIRRADGLLSVKVLDFGISKMGPTNASSPQMAMTRTTAVMGSPLYMSPEQMQSARDVDARSDIWAVGAILYELIAATTPFAGESFAQLVLNIANQSPRPIREFRPDVPRALEAVILRCLEKERSRRFQNVGELAVALLEFGPRRARSSVERTSRIIQAGGLSSSALVLPPSSDKDAVPAASGTLSTWGKTDQGPSKGGGRALVAAGIAAVALAAAAVLVVTLRSQKNESATSDASSVAPVQSAAPAAVAPLPQPPAANPAGAAPVHAEPVATVVPSVMPVVTATTSATVRPTPVAKTAAPAKTATPAAAKTAAPAAAKTAAPAPAKTAAAAVTAAPAAAKTKATPSAAPKPTSLGGRL